MGRVTCWVTVTRVLLDKGIRSAAAANGYLIAYVILNGRKDHPQRPIEL
ncbi:MAG TPA: hypothetical protein VH084_04025 [Mycobacterium sp.]|nr:hypothetical protein [Mycobacterium sp.]